MKNINEQLSVPLVSQLSEHVRREILMQLDAQLFNHSYDHLNTQLCAQLRETLEWKS